MSCQLPESESRRRNVKAASTYYALRLESRTFSSDGRLPGSMCLVGCTVTPWFQGGGSEHNLFFSEKASGSPGNEYAR